MRKIQLSTGAIMMATLMIMVAFAGVPSAGGNCQYEKTVTFWAGQNIEVGTVYITHDADNLYVTFSTNDPWWISVTHLEIAVQASLIPQTKSGSPQIGKFSWKTAHSPYVQEYKYTVPFSDVLGMDENWDWGDCLKVAAHADVWKKGCDGYYDQQTAWGEGKEFEKSWAMYFCYCPCEPGKRLPAMPEGTRPVLVRTASDAYFHTWVTWNSGEDPLPYVEMDSNGDPLGYYLGWCVDTYGKIVPGTTYSASFYSSYGTLPTDPYASLVGDDRFETVEWDQVNYLLNHKGSASAGAIQDAIWYFSGDLAYGSLGSAAKALVDDAEANGDGFFPSPDQVFAVIVLVESLYTSKVPIQLTIIEVDP